jgi:RecB family endonuclease NucS
VRLLVARSEVLLMFKDDGSFLVHDDAGGYKPLNRIRSAFRPKSTRR